MKIRLSDADRQRLGCAEWLDVDMDNLALEDAEAIEAAGGNWTDYTSKGAAAIRARVWVALHRSGVTVSPYGSFTFNLLDYQLDGVVPGKAPSAPSASPTRSRSRASAPRTRSKK